MKGLEASDGSDELEYRLTKFAAYHICRFTFGINFGHDSFLKERNEWPDFFAIFLVTADWHDFYDSFSKRNAIQTICHQFGVKDPFGEDPTRLYWKIRCRRLPKSLTWLWSSGYMSMYREPNDIR